MLTIATIIDQDQERVDAGCRYAGEDDCDVVAEVTHHCDEGDAHRLLQTDAIAVTAPPDGGQERLSNIAIQAVAHCAQQTHAE